MEAVDLHLVGVEMPFEAQWVPQLAELEPWDSEWNCWPHPRQPNPAFH